MAIITISREMGSGGIPIVHKLAEDLGYTLFNGDAIQEKAAEYGLTPEAVEKTDEKPPAFAGNVGDQMELDFHQIELMVLEAALKGNVVIYGRGGQDLLQGINSVLRVRIIAPFEERVERWAEREWLDPDLARVLVRKSDQQRAGFIKYYYDRDWVDSVYYDQIINTSRLSEEMAVKLICAAVKDKNLTELKEASKKLLQDRIIQKRVETRLLTSGTLEGMHQYHFHVSVVDGVVTLEGHLHSEEQRQRALGIIKQIEGVKSQVDNLDIRQFRSMPRDH